MSRHVIRRTAAILALALVLSGCKKKVEEKPASNTPVEEPEKPASEEPEPAGEEEQEIPPEQMDLIKYNYYVELNNDIVVILDDIEYYYQVVADEEEFSMLPDTGLTYGYRIYGKNSDILDDCVQLAGMEPDYGDLDALVKEMEESLRALMDTFSEISDSNDYADNQYQKAKEYHAVVHQAAAAFTPLAYEYMDGIAEMGDERTAQDEARMKEEGNLIIYNASRGISIAKEVVDEAYSQGVTDENITDLDLTRIRELHDELVSVVADLDAALADNDQLMKESLSNSRPFDGLYDSLIQALEWMIKQVESGQPVDLSGSGAPLGSIGHFSYVISQCIDRYNTVFVE
ncbi:MAG: YiiG family protein [Lachnospiraceae bacterium]|nr:YiiG family protein [Lachnospiraceae bacterium]